MTYFFDQLKEAFVLPLSNPVLVFSLILFIILLTPILLRKLNIPSIIGLIIAGVIIGPYGFNFLEKNAAIDLFSTIGLLYIMFIAGLDLDLNEFKSNRNKSIWFGFFTFIIPFGLGFPVCYYLLGYGVDASILISSMFSTHTMVAYPIVSKLGVAKNRAVAVTVGGTILTDTAVLIILAVVVGKHQGGLSSEFWIRLGVSLTIFTLIMFLIIPRIAKWFFKKLESEKHSHYIFVLSVVFFAAFLAEMAGLEPIIGAFFAGLALNKLIPHSSALMNRIEFMGNALFIPFFLISVGMIVDVKVILNGPAALIIAATLSVVAIAGKWLAAAVTQLVFRFSGAQRQLIFGLSGSHAAATLAVILVGYNAGILDDNILNGTVILILITCVVASFATEKAARKIMVEAEESEGEIVKAEEYTSSNILLPIENVSNTEKVEKLLEFAIFIRDKKSVHPLSVLTVVSNDEEAEVNILKARNKLEACVAKASAFETNVNVITTIDHNAASGISRIAREIMADAIILGWPSRKGFFDKLIGEKMDMILENSEKTIYVCHPAKPLILHKRIILVVPPFAEHESGFKLWFANVIRLAQELSVSVQVYGNEDSFKSIHRLYKENKFNATLVTHNFTDWDDFLILSREIKDDDLIFLVSARKGATSYMSMMDKLPAKIEKYFRDHSRIIIYPEHYSDEHAMNQYKDFSGETINKGIEAVQKLGKGIGNIFKIKDEE
ncbi:MAG TPA: cation:proton antiporter [Bacteroidales bacterium]|nr:cation:proton antiporter [Bacteroidales bacterium]